MLAPGGATTIAVEARNTVICVPFPAGGVAVVESAKTTVGTWNINDPVFRIVRNNAQIASFSREEVHVDEMRNCKSPSIARELVDELVSLKTSPA
jgi:hypothetical protein